MTASGDARLLDQQLRCLARLEGTPEEATQRSLLLAARGRYLAHSAGQATEGRRLSGEALQLARRLDDPIVLRHALGSHLGSCIGEPIPERSGVDRRILTVGGVDGLEGGCGDRAPPLRRTGGGSGRRRDVARRGLELRRAALRDVPGARVRPPRRRREPRAQGDRGSQIGRGRWSARDRPLVA